MKLRPIRSNMTELNTAKAAILFSYETPVAACIHGKEWVRTSQYYSKTTSKHINQWLDGVKAREVPQSEINALAGE